MYVIIDLGAGLLPTRPQSILHGGCTELTITGVSVSREEHSITYRRGSDRREWVELEVAADERLITYATSQTSPSEGG